MKRAFVCVAAVLACTTGFAQQVQKNVFRFGVGYMLPLSEYKSSGMGGNGPFTYTREVQSAAGAMIGYEHRVTALVGIDVSAYRFDPKVKESYSDPYDNRSWEWNWNRLTPLTLGVNFHPSKSSSIDWYVGPLVGYMSATVSANCKFFWGATAGLDVRLGKRWSVFANARYVQYEASDSEPPDDPYNPQGALHVRVNPILFAAGGAYHF